jgi:hypothetical protein
MKSRLALSLIWLGSLVAAIIPSEPYVYLKDTNGKYCLMADDRDKFLSTVLTVCRSYLTAVLAFWFIKPFRAPRTGRASAIRSGLAGLCTVLCNAFLLVALTLIHLFHPGHPDLGADIGSFEHMSKRMSIFAAPVNPHYFVSRPKHYGRSPARCYS